MRERQIAHNRAQSTVNLNTKRIQDFMYPAKKKRQRDERAAMDMKLSYESRGLLVEDEDDSTVNTVTSNMKAMTAYEKAFHHKNKSDKDQDGLKYVEDMLSNVLDVSKKDLMEKASHQYYCEQERGVYSLAEGEMLTTDQAYVVDSETYIVHKILYPLKGFMIPGERRYVVGDMKLKCGLDISKPDDVKKYAVICFNWKVDRDMKRYGYKYEERESYLKKLTLEPYDAVTDMDLLVCWEPYLYRPRNKQDLILWLNYMCPAYDPILGVHPKPDNSIKYQPYGSGDEGDVYENEEDNEYDNEDDNQHSNTMIDSEAVEDRPKPKAKFSKRGITKGDLQDLYITPDWCIDVLINAYFQHLSTIEKHILDPCCGTGVIGNVLRRRLGDNVLLYESDLYTIKDQHIDFLKEDDNSIRQHCGFIITNPPYGNNNKTKFLKKCYQIGLPFMLLLPVQSLNTPARISMFQTFGIQIMYLSPDPRFYNAETNKETCIGGVAWFCWDGICRPNHITFSYGIKANVQQKVNKLTIEQLGLISINDDIDDDMNDEESVFEMLKIDTTETREIEAPDDLAIGDDVLS